MTAKTAEPIAVPQVRSNGFTQVVFPGYGRVALYGLGVLIVVVLTAFKFSWAGLINELATLFTKGPASFTPLESTDILTVVMSILAVVIITAVMSLTVSALLSRLLGESKSYRVSAIEELLDRGPSVLFLTVATEEIISRWLFLGLLLPFFGNSHLAFLVLFLAGNLLFGALHFFNFSDKSERSLFRVIPQLIGGVMLTYVFMRWGLAVAIITHFYYDVLVVSYLKEQKPDIRNIAILIYSVIVTIVAVLVMSANGLHVSDLTGWITGTSLAPIEGYTLASYAAVLIFIDGISVVLGEALMLDHVISAPNPKGIKVKLKFPLNMIYDVFIVIVALFLLNAVLGLVIHETLTRAIIITLVLSLISPSTSGSGLARATIINLPGIFLAVIAISVLDFGTAFLLMGAFYLVSLVPQKIQAYKPVR